MCFFIILLTEGNTAWMSLVQGIRNGIGCRYSSTSFVFLILILILKKTTTPCYFKISNRPFYNWKLTITGGSPYRNTARLRGYSLRLSNDTTVPPPESSCYNDPEIVTLPTIVEEGCKRTARCIWIYQSNKPYVEPCPMLEICEVQVFGRL